MENLKVILVNDNNIEKEAFMKLIDLSIIKDDYMVVGEIKNIIDLENIIKNKNIFNFILIKNFKYIGFCQLVRRVDSYEFSRNVKINALAILPEERNKGHANFLISFILNWIKIQGCNLVYLDVVSENTSAKNLYEKLGFSKTGTLKSAFQKNSNYLDVETYSLEM